MNAHATFNTNTPALQRSLVDVVAEYDLKLAGIGDAVRAFEKAGNDLKMAATVAGVYGDVTIDTGHIYERDLKLCLLKSAWKHVYEGLNIDRVASAEDKRRWKTALEKPEPFTIDNIRGTFGRYILNPRGNILRTNRRESTLDRRPCDARYFRLVGSAALQNLCRAGLEEVENVHGLALWTKNRVTAASSTASARCAKSAT